MQDVVVIGGGVIGLTTAHALAARGLRVTVLDQGTPGQEASWAGAGILPPACPGDPQTPLARLTAASHRLWPQLSAELCEETGIDNGFAKCGGLCFSEDGHASAVDQETAEWLRAGVRVERLSAAELAECEPRVGPETGPAFRLPETWQVRNPWHLRALIASCTRLGVTIRGGQPVDAVERSGGRVISVRTATDRYVAGAYLVSAGAWSQRLLGTADGMRRIEPVRGQIVQLSTPVPLFRHVLECGPRYVVPRQDGLVLIGATEEWVGFDKRNTPSAVKDLIEFGLRLVPALADARFERAWSGLRPHSDAGMPVMGRMPGADNLYVAAGHFRAGLHLSPITAQVMTQMITEEVPDLSLDAFAPTASVD